MRIFLFSLLCALGGFLAFSAQDWVNSNESNQDAVRTELLINNPAANAEWVQSELEDEEAETSLGDIENQ